MPLPDEVLSQPRLELGTDFEDPVLSRRNSQLIRSHTAQLIDDLNSRLEPDPILVVLDVFADRLGRRQDLPDLRLTIWRQVPSTA